MNKKPKWVIFDIGGVFYDFDNFSNKLAKSLDIEEKLLLDKIDINLRSSMEGQMNEYEFWKSVLKDLALEHKFELLKSHWTAKDRFIEPTALLMNELHSAGYLIAILTNNWTGMTNYMVKTFSKYADVKYYFESAVEKLSKPDERLYRLVENRIDAKADEIYFIDDSSRNINGAKKLGWQTFLYKIGDDNGKTSNDKIRKELL